VAEIRVSVLGNNWKSSENINGKSSVMGIVMAMMIKRTVQMRSSVKCEFLYKPFVSFWRTDLSVSRTFLDFKNPVYLNEKPVSVHMKETEFNVISNAGTGKTSIIFEERLKISTVVYLWV
jgi:hypothetical protein